MKLVEGAPEGFKDVLLRVPVQPSLSKDELRFSRINRNRRGPLPPDCRSDELVKDIADRVGFVMEDLDLGEVGNEVVIVGGEKEFLVGPIDDGRYWNIEAITNVFVRIRRKLGRIRFPTGSYFYVTDNPDDDQGCKYVGEVDQQMGGASTCSSDNGEKFFVLKPKNSPDGFVV